MHSLQDFTTTEKHTLFANATTLPAFFENNLLDPARVVKVFHNDPQANIRVFYFQYLKLCFQLQNIDYEGYINRIQQVINNEGFKFIFYEEDDPSIFNDLQFKHLIMQFFGVLGDGNVSIEDALSQYPIMDTVLIYFFRAILILTGKTDTLESYIERNQLLQYLCGYFGVEISHHDRCIKFVQNDIFVYEEIPNEVFMAYMDYENSPHEHRSQNELQHNYMHQDIFQESQYESAVPEVQFKSKDFSRNGPQPLQSSSSRHGGVTEINTSYISSDFVDYTHNNQVVNLTNLVNANNLKESGTIDLPTKTISRSSTQSILKEDQKKLTDFPNIIIYPHPPVQKHQPQPTSNYEQTFTYSNNHQPVEKYSPEPTSSYNETLTYSNPTNSQGYSYSALSEKESHNATGLSNYGSTHSYHESSKNYNENNKLSQNQIYKPIYIDSKQGQAEANKNSYQETVIGKKIESIKQTKSYEWSPTKDPGFFNKMPPQYTPTQDYQKGSSLPPYQAQSYQSAQTYQPPSSFGLDAFKIEPIKPNSYSSSGSNSLKHIDPKKPTSSQHHKQPLPPTYISSYQPQYMPPQSTPTTYSTNNPFNLNVSLQFTNSFTMKAMSEPYRTTVRNIRERARNFRNSLKSFLK